MLRREPADCIPCREHLGTRWPRCASFPVLAAFAMAFSSITVVGTSLWLWRATLPQFGNHPHRSTP